MNKQSDMMTLEELFDVATRNASRMFLEGDDYEVLPMWHAVPENGGRHILIATPWGNEDEKYAAVDAIKMLFQEHKIERYAFIVEAWVVEKADTLDGPQPSKHPDRREVLRVQCEDRNGKMLSGHFYILRPEHGPPTLSPFKRDDFTAMSGRMAGLLATGGR